MHARLLRLGQLSRKRVKMSNLQRSVHGDANVVGVQSVTFAFTFSVAFQQ